MIYTEIKQRRYSVNPTPDTIKYRVETTVDIAGELPRVDIFVYAIRDVADPSLDSFAHIATLAELQNLQDERDKAITLGESYYMLPYVEMEYTDLETAIASVPTLSSRINDLVLAWITYRDDFDSAGEVSITYPTAVDSEVDTRKQTYYDAKTERIVAESVVVSSDATLVGAENVLEQSQQILTIYEAQKLFCADVINTKYPTYINLVLTGNGESAAAFSYRTGVGSLEDSMNTFCAATSAEVVSWTNTITANQTAVNSARGEKISADIELEKAEQKEAEALADVLAVCPDFDPSST